MIITYSVKNYLKMYEKEMKEEELVVAIKEYLHNRLEGKIDKLYIHRTEDVDLLKAVGTNKNFVELI